MCASREGKHHNQSMRRSVNNSLTTNHGYNISSSIKYLNYSHRDDASNGRNVQNIVIDRNVTCQSWFFPPIGLVERVLYSARIESYTRNVANYGRLSQSWSFDDYDDDYDDDYYDDDDIGAPRPGEWPNLPCWLCNGKSKQEKSRW